MTYDLPVGEYEEFTGVLGPSRVLQGMNGHQTRRWLISKGIQYDDERTVFSNLISYSERKKKIKKQLQIK